MTSRLLVLHSEGCPPDTPIPGSLPVRTCDQLSANFRALDDLPSLASLRGFPARLISQIGYKKHTSGQNGTISIPRGSIVIPCRAPNGRITALHDDRGHWFSTPQPHCVNMVRAQFTNAIHIFKFTVEADVWGLQHNDAAIALNTFRLEILSQRITGPNPHIVRYLEARAA